MSLDIYLHQDGREVFSANYTHNVGEIAEAVGLYKCVWRTEECPEIRKAGDLVEPLRQGIQKLKEDPSKFKALEPDNKWGDLKTFIPWLERYCAACLCYPDAEITSAR